jgi:HEPN domain-containing protein
MPAPEVGGAVAREWVEKAESDLKTAALGLRAGPEAPPDAICFHAQQCVEKYLKAYLALQGLPFPKTHDLEELLALLPRGVAVELSAAEQERLTNYATVTRYPGDYAPITPAEARRAVAAARRVRKGLRALLPRAALRRRRT